MSESSRVAFSVFGFPIYWYGLLIAVGLLLGILCASLREKQLGLKKDTALDFMLLALPAALVGARIYYVAFSWESYAAHPLSVFNLREGGLAIYGGVIGGVIAALIYAKWKKVSFGALADLCAPALALGQAIGRWGNFFNQEAYGVVLENPALQRFPLAVYIEADGLWHAAAFFYESAWCFLIAALLLCLERRRVFKRRGDLFAAYLFLYGLERVLVEGLRTDSLMLGPIRVSQLLSGALMLGSLMWFLLRGRRKA
ncbi:MAG: prolipoprotein diacylglyceryl transferase [Clostridia bacterium]|nr:prolipoprotein diacylglyceryl transferase [Clostridia bacterium]